MVKPETQTSNSKACDLDRYKILTVSLRPRLVKKKVTNNYNGKAVDQDRYKMGPKILTKSLRHKPKYKVTNNYNGKAVNQDRYKMGPEILHVTVKPETYT